VTPQQKAVVDRLAQALEASGADRVEHRPVSWSFASPVLVTARWNASPMSPDGFERSVLVLVDGTVL
jgi:hypothetical protein